MRKINSSLLVLGAVVATSAPTAAQNMPVWAISDICVKDSVPAQCSRSEARARNAVSGGWAVLPADVRAQCLAALKGPGDQSWRLLSECIETETLKGLGRRAIATSATPAPPLAAPLTKDGLPQPLFGVPTVAPKIQ